jgi:hypothetical protein
MKNVPLLSYDPEGDVLEVVFDESLQEAEQVAFEFRDGIVLYTTVDTYEPVQLTLVSYRSLAKFPEIHFDGWQKLTASEKKRLLPILNSEPVSAFLWLDPKTCKGHISTPSVPEIASAAA